MSKLKKYIIISSFLVFLDQAVKVIVSICFKIGVDSVKITDFLYIRPVINSTKIQQITSIASRGEFLYYILFIGKIALSLVVCALFCYLLCILEKHMFSIIKERGVTLISIILLISAAICVTIDRIFYGGSLDYIGIAFQTGEKIVSDHTHPLYTFIIFDIKDIYITLCVLLVLSRLILVVIDYIRSPKNKKAEINESMKEKLNVLNIIKKNK